MSHRFSTMPRLGGVLALAPLALAVGLALGGPAGAQQAPQQAQSQGQGQQPAPETQTFQDWTLACVQQDGQRGCRMLQNVPNEQGQVMMQTAVFALPDGRPGLLFNLPLGVWLPEGVTFQIDGGQEVNVPYARCLPPPDQCRVELILTEDLVNQLKAGTSVSVTFYDPRQQPVRARVSLLGFTAAFDGLGG